MKDGASHGTYAWESLVDFGIFDNGILLFPQKNIFHWIPGSTLVEGGTWQDFETLVSKKIRQKV